VTLAKPHPAKFSVGDKVEGLFGGLSEWYPAVVTTVHPNNTYDLHYDDGDKENEVEENNVRILKSFTDEKNKDNNDNSHTTVKKEETISQPVKKVIKSSNLDSFLDEISDDESKSGGEPWEGLDAGKYVTAVPVVDLDTGGINDDSLENGLETGGQFVKSDYEYEEDFD
jgi:hypothetical protein